LAEEVAQIGLVGAAPFPYFAYSGSVPASPGGRVPQLCPENSRLLDACQDFAHECRPPVAQRVFAKAWSIAALFQAASEGRIDCAQLVSARIAEVASRFRPPRCSALATKGDLPNVRGPPNYLRDRILTALLAH